MATPTPTRASTPTTRSSARDRLLAAANELFYEHGVQTVGIDRIIEHAGVAKASLYSTFGSKDGLVRAYLEQRGSTNMARIENAIASGSTPRDQLLAIFESQAALMAKPGYRGCAFVAASAETDPGSSVQQASDAYRAWLRERFRGLAEAAGASDPDRLAQQLHVVYDGTMLAGRMDRSPDVAVAARAAAEGLIDASILSGVSATP